MNIKELMFLSGMSLIPDYMKVKTSKDEIVFYLETPGFKKEDFKIKLLLDKDFVKISIKSKKESIFASGYDESIVFTHKNIVQDKDKFKVECEDGILKLIIPLENHSQEFEL